MGKITPESIVLAGCLRYLQLRGIYHWRNNTGAVRIRPGQFMSFGKKGSSDILGILPDGKFLAVEVKAPDGRLSPEQRQFIQALRDFGGLAVVVKSWQDLDTALKEAGYSSGGPLFEDHAKSEKVCI
ncbi:hypothetical protein FACS189450_10250 [Spirochaetia bacterium]|nr:hypothetical protein FACS189450_10250 [Spirochaetia bacterium]